MNRPKLNANKQLFAHNVRKFLWEFPDLEYDGCTVTCLVCEKDLLCWNRRLCIKHINSQSHQNRKSGQRPYTVFLFDLIFMLAACNIPFNVINKEPFRHLSRKYNPQWKIPTSTTLRRYLPYLRERIENNIKSQIRNKNLWLTLDETIDHKKHSVVNVVVRILNPLGPSPPYLIASKRLQVRSREAVQNLILSTLETFEIPRHQLLMVVTNSTSTMVRACGSLKNVCTNAIHITCILHALYLVAETICQCYPDVDQLIKQTKAVFLKSPKNIRQFRQHCPGIPEPPQLIPTGWGTWLEASLYYFKHFQKIKSLVLQLDAKESAAIRKSQMKFQDGEVEAQLENIHNNYVPIVDAIKHLQNTSLSLDESLQIVDDLRRVLYTLSDEISVPVRHKFDNLLRKNPDLARLRDLHNNSPPTDPLTVFGSHFKYAPITSLDGEQSLSLYNNIFSPLRTGLKESTAETYAMFQMFAKAHPNL